MGMEQDSMAGMLYRHTVTQATHCDPLMNRLAGYVMPGNQSLIYTSSITPTFVEAKHGLGLGLVANKREGVELANSSGLNQSKFSLSFWVKDAKHPEQYGVIISHYNRNSSAGWSVDAYSNGTSSGTTSIFCLWPKGDIGLLHLQVPIPTTTFVHIVATFDGSSIRIYKNGILLAITGYNGKYIPNVGLPLVMGSSSYCLECNSWSGVIDDLRYYNRTIDKNEVKEIFVNDSLGTVSHGLVGHWTFENTLNDMSGNKHNGNLLSMILTWHLHLTEGYFSTRKIQEK